MARRVPQTERTYRRVHPCKFYGAQGHSHASHFKIFLLRDDVGQWNSSHELAFAEAGAHDPAMPPPTPSWLSLLLEPEKPLTEEP